MFIVALLLRITINAFIKYDHNIIAVFDICILNFANTYHMIDDLKINVKLAVKYAVVLIYLME